MIPQLVYNGKASALYDLFNSETAPDIVKVKELIDAGIDLRYQVRSLVRADTIH
jgi:hypothetical protein